MKRILLLLPLIAACSQEPSQPEVRDATTGIFAGEGRDRYCIKQSGDAWRVGIVTYGVGNTNCTFKGRVIEAYEHDSLIEAVGDKACRFYVESDGKTLRMPRKLPAACNYYCGPGATLAGKAFTNDPGASPAVDFAGDPLC